MLTALRHGLMGASRTRRRMPAVSRFAAEEGHDAESAVGHLGLGRSPTMSPLRECPDEKDSAFTANMPGTRARCAAWPACGGNAGVR